MKGSFSHIYAGHLWCSVMPVVIILAFFLCTVNCETMKDQDKSEWIDPGDMLNFDSHYVQRDPDSHNKVKLTMQHNCNLNAKIEQELQECKIHLKELVLKYESCQTDKDSKPLADEPYFKQYVRTFLNYLEKQLPSSLNEDMSFAAVLQLSPDQISILRKFTESSGSLQDASSVLSDMIQEVRITSHLDAKTESWESLVVMVSMVFQVACSIAASILSIKLISSLHLSWGQLFVKILIFLFIISIGWTWVHLYKKAVAEKVSNAMKEIPTECKPGDTSWQHNLFDWFTSSFTFQEDKCAKYHENFIVDPFWEVTPTQAVAITMTKFILEPAGHMGQAINKFFHGLLHGLPAQLWPVALIIVLFLTVFILIMGCGYKVRIPFFLSIEPTHPPVVTNPHPQPGTNALPPSATNAISPTATYAIPPTAVTTLSPQSANALSTPTHAIPSSTANAIVSPTVNNLQSVDPSSEDGRACPKMQPTVTQTGESDLKMKSRIQAQEEKIQEMEKLINKLASRKSDEVKDSETQLVPKPGQTVHNSSDDIVNKLECEKTSQIDTIGPSSNLTEDFSSENT